MERGRWSRSRAVAAAVADASAVALADLMYVAKDLIGLYYKTEESLLLLVIAYFIILLPISLLSRFIEKRLRYGQFGNA